MWAWEFVIYQQRAAFPPADGFRLEIAPAPGGGRQWKIKISHNIHVYFIYSNVKVEQSVASNMTHYSLHFLPSLAILSRHSPSSIPYVM